MYLVDFFKRMTRKSNIPVLIYLILNVFVIAGIILFLFNDSGDMPFIVALLLSLAVYALSLTIALSPLGEWILRFQTGCTAIGREDIANYIQPLFDEVYAKARALDPSIPDNVQLFMNDDASPNAFATGRRTVCVTEGMLRMPPEQIKATLAHEFGHLAHKDTDLILLVSVGNLIVTAFIMFIRVVLGIAHFIMSLTAIFIGGSEGAWAALLTTLYHALISITVTLLMWIWTKLGTLLVMKSSRSNEYEADAFAFQLGYGSELCGLLDTICGSGAKGLFATLASSHPNKNDRIARLQSFGAEYSAAYRR